MNAIERLARNGARLNENAILKQLFLNNDFKNLVLDLNRDVQLYEKGIDALGRTLGEYSPATIEGTKNFKGKKEKRQRYDHITLNDTGAFYKSFKLEQKGNSAVITADTLKGDTDLQKVWGRDILGLTNESLQEAIDLAYTIVIPLIRQKLFQGV